MFLAILSIIIGILGLFMAYVSFVDPRMLFLFFLKNPERWERFSGLKNSVEIFRHKTHPDFQIRIDWDNEVVEDFHEDWMDNNGFYPRGRAGSFLVQMFARGVLLDTELFVDIDDNRNFVPVPKKDSSNKAYFYNEKQLLLSRIVGKYHYHETIEDFANQHNIYINKSL